MAIENKDAGVYVTVQGTVISEDQALEFLKEKWAGKEISCPVCQNKVWDIIFSPAGTGAYAAFEFFDEQGDLSTRASGPNVPVFLTACSSCGYMRTHSLMIVRSWVKEKEDGR
jgi:hypothetical protein